MGLLGIDFAKSNERGELVFKAVGNDAETLAEIAGSAQLTEAVAEQVASSLVFADRGELFASKVRYGVDNVAFGIAGDSTGNQLTEWIDLLAAKIGADYPALRVLIKQWNTGTESYDADVEVQPGTPGAVGVVFHDSFGRVAADLYNTTPDTGSAWGRDGSNANGDWSIDGTRAVRTADTTGGAMLADVLQTGSQKITLNGTLSTTPAGTVRQMRFYFNYAGPTDHMYVQLSIAVGTGVPTLSISKRIANVVTTLQTATAVGLTANLAGQAFAVTAGIVGTAASVTLNGQTLGGTLTAPDVATLSGGTKAGFTGSGFLAGDTIEDFKVEITDASAPRELVLWNASASGEKLDYQLPRVAAMFPSSLDVLFVSSVHNYGTDLPAAHWSKIDAFMSAFRVVQPTSGVIISSQNPRKPPAISAQHASRNVALASYAARRGYGYLPVFEAFSALGDGGWSLINSDGIHPTLGAVGTGSALWRDVAEAYLNAIG